MCVNVNGNIQPKPNTLKIKKGLGHRGSGRPRQEAEGHEY